MKKLLLILMSFVLAVGTISCSGNNEGSANKADANEKEESSTNSVDDESSATKKEEDSTNSVDGESSATEKEEDSTNSVDDGSSATEKEEEPEMDTYALGETVETQLMEFTLDRADLAIALNNTLDKNYALPKEYDPDKDQNNPFVASKGTTYVPVTFTIKNLDRASLDIDFVDVFTDSKIKVILDGETYTLDDTGMTNTGITYCYELFADGGYDKYEYGNILLKVGEKRTFRAYVKIPVDVEDLGSGFIITFDLPDINKTLVEYAYKVTKEDREAILEKDRQAAEEERKRIEEMNAVELAELDEETEARLVRTFSGWSWQYTDDNNCRYDIKFVDDTNITVKVTVGNTTITNSGIYEFRNKVVYIRYQNGGEAKLPYVEHDGGVNVFPIVGMDKSGTYEFRAE